MIVIHGEDNSLSYKRLIALTEEYKKQQLEIVIHEASELDITTFRQEISNTGLFGISKCIVIKNLFGGTKSKDNLVLAISSVSDQEIVIWENKEVTATNLKKIPKAKVENFKVNPVIFKFLDALKPGNAPTLLLAWKKILDMEVEPEYVFSMLVRQIRLLIQAKTGQQYLKMAPYPAKMVIAQSKYFTAEHLIDLHRSLYEIDKKIKTGTSPVTIDHLLANFFQKV